MLKPTTKSLFSAKMSIMLALLMTGFIFATDPTLNIQGVLRDSDGQAVADGNYDITFYLYDAETGGSSIWNETHSSIPVTNGVYSTTIGGASSLGNLAFDVPYYLAVGVNGGAESTPRIPLSLSPYALSMRGVDNVFPSSGNVGVGASSPNVDLAIGDNDTGIDYNSDDGSLTIQSDNVTVNGRIQDKTGFVSPVGSVIAFAGSTAPDGWLLCDGTGYSPGIYPDLHAVIGNSFGSAGGNFRVPDLRTRVPVGRDDWPEFTNIGNYGGEIEHTLTEAEMPSHQHDLARRDSENTGMGHAQVSAGGSNGMVSNYSYGGDNNLYHPSDSDAYHAKPTGGGEAHNNMPPFVVMNYIIKY